MNHLKIDSQWCMVENCFDINNNRHYESLFALGTGYMTTRASMEEGFEDDDQAMEYNRYQGNVTLETIPAAKSKWGTYMPVVQARHPFLNTGLVNLPYSLGLVIFWDGEKLDMEKSLISDYCRWLDLKEATLYRKFTWNTKNGKRIELCFSRFMNPEEKFVCVQTCQIRVASGRGDLQVISFVDNNIRTNGFDIFTQNLVNQRGSVIFSDVTTNRDVRVITASRLMVDGFDEHVIEKEPRRIKDSIQIHLNEGQEVTVNKVSATAVDLYFGRNELLDAAIEMVNRNSEKSIDELHFAHRTFWERLWKHSDVEIEIEDDEGYHSQLAIRSAIYHLLRAKAEDEERSMICPKGTTTEVYFGSTFWDMEIFIQPFYLYTNQKMARTSPMFRYHNLKAAKEIASGYGYSGARYPWQSDCYGNEVCSMFQYADHQVHITSDVVLGLWHYYQNTLDNEFLFNYGVEIILETARYWIERVDKIPGRPGYQLLGVMGPDEYKHFSNNNAYTNFGVKVNLRLARKVVEMMKTESLTQFQRLSEKIHFEEKELDQFDEVAEGLAIGMDEKRQIVWQCDHFDTDYATIDIEGIWKDRDQLFGRYVTQEKRYRSKTMKQSDVIALMGLFPNQFTLEQKRASLAYYDQYNIHDSSNSMCHQMIVSANAGQPESAFDAWKKSIDIDFGKLPRSSDGIHMANVGGMWQEIVFGFCGMISALDSDILTFNPCLPPQIKHITYRIQWKLVPLKITVSAKHISIQNLSDHDLAFEVKGEHHLALANKTIEVGF